jgi:hypothetical protein
MAIDPNLITTVRVGELPTGAISLTDKIAIEKSDNTLYQGTLQQLLDLFRPLVGKLAYEAVDLIVDNQYIIDNFILTPGSTMGLGINLCAGFAIRNGNNGTDNADGRVDIGYGTNYNAIRAIGGSTDAVLVAHSHLSGSYNTGGGTVLFTGKGLVSGSDTVYLSTQPAGESGVGKNMQPYRVVLKLMKLP